MQDPKAPLFALTCADPRETIRRVNAAGVFPGEAPEYVTVDDKKWTAAYDFDAVSKKAVRLTMVEWAPGQGSFGFDRRGLARVGLPPAFADAARLRGLLEKVPFRWLSAATLSRVWGPGGQPTEYFGPGFAEGHYDHGWCCAFRGDGHDQLVSRRWLEYGPWRLVRGADDLSLVQFHDLAASDEEALAQAKVGHQRMGISAEGGFIEPAPWTWEFPALRNLYDPGAQMLTVVVHGRPVSEAEMLEACAIRRYQPLEHPVKNVAFVFLQESEARAHLHQLWLRGLECRAVIAGREVRLDDSHHPPAAVVPGWVKAVQDREGF